MRHTPATAQISQRLAAIRSQVLDLAEYARLESEPGALGALLLVAYFIERIEKQIKEDR